MNEEMQLRYLYFLTMMYSGTERWKEYYEAWGRMSKRLDPEEYAELIDKITAFNKKYRVKKHRKQKKP